MRLPDDAGNMDISVCAGDQQPIAIAAGNVTNVTFAIRDRGDDQPSRHIVGDDDQIVPYSDAALLQAKLVKGSTLKATRARHTGCARRTRTRSARICSRFSRVKGRVARPHRQYTVSTATRNMYPAPRSVWMY